MTIPNWSMLPGLINIIASSGFDRRQLLLHPLIARHIISMKPLSSVVHKSFGAPHCISTLRTHKDTLGTHPSTIC